MKDAYWFSHDANSRNDQKILAIRMKYGMQGYGIFFGIIEIMRESDSYALLDDCPTIAYDLREPIEIVEDIIKNYDLFVFEDNKFFSKSLKKRMQELEENRIKRSIAGRKGGIASSSKRQANVNDCLTSKVKESKVKESKVITTLSGKPDLVYPIKYLNEKTKRSFSPTNLSNQRIIRARYAEGRTLEDFKKVIDRKTGKWLTDEKMSQYLRPSTLFNQTNFENYLNEKDEVDNVPDSLKRFFKKSGVPNNGKNFSH